MGPSSQTARSTGSRTRPCISSLYVTSATTSGTARGRASAASELRSVEYRAAVNFAAPEQRELGARPASRPRRYLAGLMRLRLRTSDDADARLSCISSLEMYQSVGPRDGPNTPPPIIWPAGGPGCHAQ